MNTELENKDKEILSKELSEEELKEVLGSWGSNWGEQSYADMLAICNQPFANEKDINSCIKQWKRDIYANKFPNCAATVGDGSWCGTNDACYSEAVSYQNMTDCHKAWK